ncbi:MAG: hypothetical protein A2494_00725 [Candidatus Lloydbacteria bacterium RIFOXYC12_FULL_46_25]|uniref:Uncharacterized protein n=1 Tax=Candidatus Lloydbacteria bacterium RIFOXYC12_FULL_46_25 TaxID=1798670 RepID=A0A1G2DUP6_9BACT|nr:MAG: hypothetical protein A2494_00725 [Candidatus Lloydbacteria bacterium RIFOXYC12_FULL_46_25]
MKKIITAAMLMGPMMAFAAPSGPLANTLNQFQDVVAFLIPVLLSLAVLVFFWGLVKYIANASDEASKESGKTLMIWGMIAIFVMVAFWGIIGYVQNSLGLSGSIVAPVAPVVSLVPTT